MICLRFAIFLKDALIDFRLVPSLRAPVILVDNRSIPGNVDIPWNRPVVYEYYRRTQGWDEAKVDQSIFQKYSETETNHTAYDPQSIMEYPIDKSLTLNGFEDG